MTQRPVGTTLEERSNEMPSQKTVQGTEEDKDEPEIAESSWIRMLENLNVERDIMASILEIKIHFAWAELWTE